MQQYTELMSMTAPWVLYVLMAVVGLVVYGWALLLIVGIVGVIFRKKTLTLVCLAMAMLWVGGLMTVDMVRNRRFDQVKDHLADVRTGMDQAEVVTLIGEPDMTLDSSILSGSPSVAENSMCYIQPGSMFRAFGERIVIDRKKGGQLYVVELDDSGHVVSTFDPRE